MYYVYFGEEINIDISISYCYVLDINYCVDKFMSVEK